MADVGWFKTAVFYEVPIYAFHDSNGDGIGDIAGLTERLDYLQWLGVDCLWILPFYESPLRDGGYDVSDFRSVLPAYGTVDDLRRLVGEVHRRDMRIIADFVVNHTSDQHAWFQEARKPGSPMRDRYVWTDDSTQWSEARVIFTDTHDSNWTWDDSAEAYYWHRFFDHQPDLNYDNVDVRREVEDAIRFWMEIGLDGLRLDAVPYLFERDGTNGENLPETHAYLKQLRAMVDREFPDSILLAEANQWPEDVVDYFGDGDECHMAFHFPVMPRLFMALKRQSAESIVDILSRTPAIPDNAQWGIFLRNHDELTLEMVTAEERAYMYEQYAPDPAMRKNLGIRRRLAPLVDGDRRRIELLNGLLLSLPGSPILYYGDEIGMGDMHRLDDRDGVRTPMQWDATSSTGFSRQTSDWFYLPVVDTPGYTPAEVNVADQRDDGDSLLSWVRAMLAVRRRHTVFGVGGFEPISAEHSAVFAYRRTSADSEVLVVANMSDAPVATTLESTADFNSLLGNRVIDDGRLQLDPYEFDWLR
ncbi:MAG: maltose alpha-D-glucosyltransferase [bacterium]|nr:maltose alpha-D-glucosyltransferase [bacterium]